MTIDSRREIIIARACTFATLALFAGLFHFLFLRGQTAYALHDTRGLFEVILYAAAMFFMAYSTMLYQICLIGYYKRRKKHRPASRAELESIYGEHAPSLAILIPSYKEEHNVIWQTMISAALAEYPRKDIVLLIDDPQHPRTLEDRRLLEDARQMPATLQRLFGVPCKRFCAELNAYILRAQDGRTHAGVELNRLSILYDEAADWLETLAGEYVTKRGETSLSHIDRFFIEKVIAAPALAHRERARELRRQVQAGNAPQDTILRQYQRLSGLFDMRFSGFERKKYASLSHDANKAMNLNSYISLMGKSWKEVESRHGLLLMECLPGEADFTIAAPDFVNTIDADTQMLTDYALRLVHVLRQPGNERIAVIQSPCSAFPDCPGRLEHTAGIAIDLGFRTHQGYTHWDATFWVGANAMLRYAALQDIRETRQENGNEVSIFIQDRTVIEDTESSVDLVHRGWRLYNYPERMTFSPTPPDFGSLLIQRRRWANGHLLILPKLLHYALRAPKRLALFKEFFMRFNYLISTMSGCLLALLFFFYSFGDGIETAWMPLSTLPFVVLYIRDLRNANYRASDFLRVYALNLMLVPVQVGGLLKSFEQILTGRKIPFGRTPKVPGRTSAPAIYGVIEMAIPLISLIISIAQGLEHHWSQAALALLNGAFMLYALVFFIGVKETTQDIAVGMEGTWRNLEARTEAWVASVRKLPALAWRLRPQSL